MSASASQAASSPQLSEVAIAAGQRMQAFAASSEWARATIERAVALGADPLFARSLRLELARIAGDVSAGGALEPLATPRTLAWWLKRAVSYVGHSFEARAADVTPADVLFLPRMANHMADMLPLADALRSRGLRVAFAAPPLSRNLQRDELTWFDIADPDAAGGVSELLSLVRSMKVTSDAATETELEAVRAPMRRAVVTQTCSECAPVYVGYRRGLSAILEAVQPQLLVVGNPNTTEGSVAVGVARQHGVATVALQHGSIGSQAHAWADTGVTRLLTWGSDVVQSLVECGVSPESVCAVGCPRLDGVLKRFVHEARPRQVLVASSGAGHQVGAKEHQQFIDTVYQAAGVASHWEWVIKLHPKDNQALYDEAAQRWPNARVAIVPADRARQGLDIFDYLSKAVTLITVVSTTALDAMTVGVPVISVQPSVEARRGHHHFIEFCEIATDYGSLVRLVDRAHHQPTSGRWAGAETFIESVFAHRGNAAAAAANACLELLPAAPSAIGGS